MCFSVYKSKYFSRRNKSTKSTYFRRIATDSYKYWEHLHADRGRISCEVIQEKILKLIIIIIMMKNRKNLSFLSGCGKALPALSWTHKCECRLEV